MGRLDGFWSIVCQFRTPMKIVLILNLAFWILLAASFPTLEPGTPSYVVAQLNVIILGATTVIVGGLFLGCMLRE